MMMVYPGRPTVFSTGSFRKGAWSGINGAAQKMTLNRLHHIDTAAILRQVQIGTEGIVSIADILLEHTYRRPSRRRRDKPVSSMDGRTARMNGAARGR
jgi:hypothetical protein